MEENNITTGRAEKANPLNDASGNKNKVPCFEKLINKTKNSLTVLKILSIKLTLEINSAKIIWRSTPEKINFQLIFFLSDENR